MTDNLINAKLSPSSLRHDTFTTHSQVRVQTRSEKLNPKVKTAKTLVLSLSLFSACEIGDLQRSDELHPLADPKVRTFNVHSSRNTQIDILYIQIYAFARGATQYPICLNHT